MESSARQPNRRKILAVGAAAATGAWIAPSITRLDRVSAAQPSCSQNWDAGLSGWTIDNTYGPPAARDGLWRIIGTTAVPPIGAGRTFSGAGQSLHYGRGQGNNYRTFAGGSGTEKANSGAVTSATVTLPASGSLPFNFRLWRQVEGVRGGGGTFDRLRLFVVVGATETAIWSIDNTTPSTSSWTLVSTTVPATFLGQTVRYRFVFETLDATNNAFEGLYIDDVNYPC